MDSGVFDRFVWRQQTERRVRFFLRQQALFYLLIHYVRKDRVQLAQTSVNAAGPG